MSNLSKSKYSSVVPLADVEHFEHPEKPTVEDIAYYKGNVQPLLFQLSNMITQKCPEAEIFSFLGLSESKFYLYKKWFPDFRNAVTQGKCSMTARMEHALEQVAVGGDYEETETVNVYEPDPTTGELVLVQRKERVTKKVAPPSVRAIEMYLTNRDPANWKKSQSDNITQNNTATVINVSESDLKGFLDEFKSKHLIDTRKPISVVEVVDE